MRDTNWFGSTEEGRKTSSWMREDVTRAMLSEWEMRGHWGSSDCHLGKNKLVEGQ